jgi:hypothetical protein
MPRESVLLGVRHRSGVPLAAAASAAEEWWCSPALLYVGLCVLENFRVLLTDVFYQIRMPLCIHVWSAVLGRRE